ncbi:MAG: type 4a pilus biogenesis protein PilO [Desulfobacterales bacterium]|nr:type 4a pilus biogenesis protein PilO [Desulfobacterales bacterium]
MEKLDIYLKSLEPVFDTIEQLPLAQRIAIFVGSILLIIGAFVYFSFMPKWENMSSLSSEQENLMTELNKAKKKASELKKYEALAQEAEKEFQLAKSALPEAKDIPALIESVSQAGNEAGLEFILFQPTAEQVKDFYAEIPVSIQVVGRYNNIALFFDNVAMLKRIVNIANISMVPLPPGKEDGLTTSCTATTYRFVEKKDNKDNKDKKETKKETK